MGLLMYRVFKLCPDTDFSDELGPPVIRDSWKNNDRVKSEAPSSDITMMIRPTSSYHDLRSSPTTDDYKIPLHLLPEPRLSSEPRVDQKRHRHRSDAMPESDSSATTDESLLSSSGSELKAQASTAALTLRSTDECIRFADDPQSVRFHGRSSVLGLVDATVKYRQNLLKESANLNVNTQSRYPSDDSTIRHTRRAEFWRMSKVRLSFFHFVFQFLTCMHSGSWLGKVMSTLIRKVSFIVSLTDFRPQG